DRGRDALIERARSRDATERISAVVALAKLQHDERARAAIRAAIAEHPEDLEHRWFREFPELLRAVLGAVHGAHEPLLRDRRHQRAVAREDRAAREAARAGRRRAVLHVEQP